MSNNIPQKTRQEVYDRADYRCEICGDIRIDGIHHVIKRRHRNHRAEALILLCPKCHRLAEQEHKLGRKLKLRLQRYYEGEGYSEDKIRRLMGGRLYFEEG